jgi:hypothetical protein
MEEEQVDVSHLHSNRLVEHMLLIEGFLLLRQNSLLHMDFLLGKDYLMDLLPMVILVMFGFEEWY